MYQIGMLWMRGGLSFIEQLCVKSFVDAGHPTILYSYAPIDRVPDGVERRDAADILPEEGFLTHERTGSPALHSDLFRYRLLDREENMIWADTDAYCMRPFTTDTGHFYGWESEKHVNGGVLGLPKGCATLEALLAHTRDEFAIPTWYKPDYTAELRAARDAGTPVHAGEQPWGVWGPHAITHFLTQTGEIRHAHPREVLYPYAFRDRRKMVKSSVDPAQYLTENTLSVHLYGRRMRKFLAEQYRGIPDPEGLVGQLLIKHGIDPLDAPLRDFPDPDRDHPDARAFREAINGKTYPVKAAAAAAPAPAEGIRPLKSVVAVTTMKNEAPYILDWVAYHLSIGVTHFLVYTNDCTDGTEDILDLLGQSGIVTRVANPADIDAGQRPQRIALELAARHPLVREADAHIVMDVDEYINVHVGQGHLSDLFEACGDPQMISMTWRFFGGSGVLDFQDTPVPAQFLRCAPQRVRVPHHNWGFKTIVRRDAPFDTIGIHRPLGPTTKTMPAWTNGSGQQMPGSYLDGGWRSNKRSWGYDLVTLNHYSVRSLDAYLLKRDRGRTNHVNRDQGIGYWNIHNRNDENDASILPRLKPAALMRDVLLRTHPGLDALHTAGCDWHRARVAELRKDEVYGALYDRLAVDPLSHEVDEDLPEMETETAVVPSAPSDPPEPARPKPRKPKIDDLMQSAHPDLIRMDNGDVLATGEVNAQVYAAMDAKAEAAMPRLAPLSARQSNQNIVVISGMRNEAPFILEWIAYHLSIGVSHFLIYTNDCDDPTNEILDCLAAQGLVTRRDNPFEKGKGQKPQRIALNDAITQPVVQAADWYLPIDVDEFVNVHHGDGNLPRMLDEMNDPNVVSMLWRFFGTDSQAIYRDRWITEQFFACAPRFVPKVGQDEENAHGIRSGAGIAPQSGRLMAWGIKTMVHRTAPFDKIGVHRPLQVDETLLDRVRWVNGSGRQMPAAFMTSNNWRANRNSAGYGMVTLNHYALRSAESYLVKKQRGRINHVDEDQDQVYWTQRNYTTERDDSILARLPAAKDVLARLLRDPDLASWHQKAVDWHKARITTLLDDPEYRALYQAITAPMPKP